MTADVATYLVPPLASHHGRGRALQGGQRDVADASPGYPCRACLCDAEVGEELLLVSHDPFAGPSPYRCASPIFLHAGAAVIDGVELADLLVRMFGEPGVERVHVHNATRGCWAATIERVGRPP